MIGRRSLVLTGGIVAAATAAVRKTRAQETSLVVYTAFEDGQIAPLTTAFTKANPAITVRHFHQPGEELLGTLSLELQARQSKADVVGLNEASLLTLNEKLAAIEPYAAAGQDKLLPGMIEARALFTPAFVNLYLIHYNIKALQGIELPKRWADLTDPRFKNLISMADPASSQSVQSFIWFIANYLGTQDKAVYGWDYFTRLKDNAPRLEASHGTIRDLTVSGERPIGIQLLANAQTAMNRGEATGLVWPAEGSPGELSAFAMLKSSPNKAAARLWLDFILSPEAQALVPRSLGGAPVRADTEYKFPGGAALSDVKVVRVDAAYIAANRRGELRKFRAAMGL